MFSKNKTIVLFVALLLVLNFIFIFKNIEKQKSINELQLQIVNLENLSIYNKVSKIINYTTLDQSNKETKNNKLMLISLLKGNVCGTCLENEIKYLNNINSEFRKYIKVYYEGYSNDLKKLGAHFEIIEVVNLSDKFQIPDNNLDNPASFVIDKNGYILFYHKAIPGRPEVSAEFFEKIKSLFQSVYEN